MLATQSGKRSSKNDEHHRRQFANPNSQSLFQPTIVSPPKNSVNTISSQIRRTPSGRFSTIINPINVIQNLASVAENPAQTNSKEQESIDELGKKFS
jgi:hypothetical protein